MRNIMKSRGTPTLKAHKEEKKSIKDTGKLEK